MTRPLRRRAIIPTAYQFSDGADFELRDPYSRTQSSGDELLLEDDNYVLLEDSGELVQE